MIRIDNLVLFQESGAPTMTSTKAVYVHVHVAANVHAVFIGPHRYCMIRIGNHWSP